MQKSRTVLCAGQRVEARSERWLVMGRESFGRTQLVILRGIGDDNFGETARLIAPFDQIVALGESTAIRAAPRSTVLKTAAAAIAAAQSWRECWTAATSRIELRPWQLEPALDAIRGETRFLLADEVGLGKTIQAALIVSELLARSLAERVLILTPASLRHQWIAELSEKFDITATLFDHSNLNLIGATLPPDVNPWRTAPIIVSSIDLVKRPEVRSALDEVPFDILIVDEAHHLTPGSDRGAVVGELAARTPWVVLVTATPHSGDDAAHRFLCSLGSAGEDRAPAIYRRTKLDIGPVPPRRVRLFSVTPTIEERRLLDSTLAYARALWRIPSTGVQLVASVIARRAASSAQAAAETLERRLALLGQSISPVTQARLPWDEGDHADEVIGDEILGLPGLAQDDELVWLRQLVTLASAAAARSSKLGVIRRLLRRTAEPLLIFSEYRDVVVSTASAIADVASVVVIHGGVTGHSRRELLTNFIDGRARVLVTTDAAGEGLNLQQRCRLLINLELPWNPLRLEQRIGRIDRLGQRRTVHALHLFHRDSFEDLVLANLERRRGRVAAATRPMAQCEVTSPAEVERRLRSWSSQLRRPSDSKALYARRDGRGRNTTGVVMLFGVDILDGASRLVQRSAIAVHVTLPTLLRTRRLAGKVVSSLMTAPRLRALLERELSKQLVQIGVDTALTALALEARSRRILQELSRQDRDPLVQGSLFDRRSEQRARARAAALLVQRDQCARRLSAASALTTLSAREPRLIAAWPLA